NSRVWRALAAGALLAVPLAFTLPQTIRHEVDAPAEHSRVSPVEADVVPPFGFGASRNVPLLLGIRRLMPEDARISFVPRGGAEAQRIFIETGWIRWVAFAIAPRLVDAGTGAPWVVVVHQTPRQAHVRD